MPLLNEYCFKSSDCKHDIYVREWLPEVTPIGVLQIVHGVAEHISRYDEFARYMAEKGFVVSGNDHLGHGKSVQSEEELGYFGENGGWELVVGDVRKLYERLRDKYHNMPMFIFGHSMGSFITRTYITRYHDGPDGVILSGTGQQSGLILSAGIMMAKREIRKHGADFHSEMLQKMAFGGYNKKIKDPISENAWLSRNEDNVRKYDADPLCGTVSTAALFRDMLTGIKYISSPRNIARVNKTLPILLVAGRDDPVGDYGKAVHKVYSAYLDAGIKDVTIKLYPDDRHEILNEPNKDQVMKDVSDWISARL